MYAAVTVAVRVVLAVSSPHIYIHTDIILQPEPLTTFRSFLPSSMWSGNGPVTLKSLIEWYINDETMPDNVNSLMCTYSIQWIVKFCRTPLLLSTVVFLYFYAIKSDSDWDKKTLDLRQRKTSCDCVGTVIDTNAHIVNSLNSLIRDPCARQLTPVYHDIRYTPCPPATGRWRYTRSSQSLVNHKSYDNCPCGQTPWRVQRSIKPPERIVQEPFLR